MQQLKVNFLIGLINVMKLLLTSGGIRTQEIADELARLTGMPLSQVKIAIIDEASAVETGDKRWKIDELNMLAEHIKGEIDFIGLLALSLDEVKERIESCDVIYVLGGNPDYLMHVFQKTGFDKLLRDELLAQKVYVGSSAGSMVLTRRAKTKEYLDVYAKTKNFGIDDYLGIVDMIFRPHLASSNDMKYQYDTLAQVAEGLTYDLYGLRDDQAICVEGGKLLFVGGETFFRQGSEG